MKIQLAFGCVLAMFAASGEVHEMNVEDPWVREKISPVRIVWTSGPAVARADALLRSALGQVPEFGWVWDRMDSTCCVLTNDGRSVSAVLLDFGRELHGGLRLAVSAKSSKGMKVRVRFGESVAEAMSELGERGSCNDHAIRDSEILLPTMGTREIGNTGFRFVRIDLLTLGKLAFESVHAVSLMRPMKRLGGFRCSDERLNRIFDTAVRTVHLCCQDFVWDGIKRDRLVWMGDMHPETMVILNVFGADPIVPETLGYVAATTRPEDWVNGFPTYTLWWLRNMVAWHRYTGDRAWLGKYAGYIARTFDQVLTALHADGWSVDGECGLFLDWPTHHDRVAERAGVQALALMAARDVREMGEALASSELTAKADRMIGALEGLRPDPHGAKSAAALLALSGQRDARETFASVLGRDGNRGISTFYGYYALEAMSAAGENRRALDTVRDYWGAMLDVGATSFWEGFDIAWTNKCFRIDEMPVKGKRDIHGDYGEYCYKGFRHSLCHGWSGGPAAWCINHVLGIRSVGIGCKKISVTPFLGDLAWAEGAMALPDGGKAAVKVRKADGRLAVTVDLDGRRIERTIRAGELIELSRGE